jgi:TPR repeat protein
MLRTDPPPQPAPQARPAARPPDAPPPDAPLPSPEARERALRLVKKGDEQLAEGAIAQARLLYERAAEAGSALGAMALAATYDPAELRRLGALGLKADREAARRWYERARQLGAAEAEQRLRRLGGD